jgi:hypothetical protein
VRLLERSNHALRSNRLGLLGFHPCSSIGFYFILFIRGAFAPVIRSSLPVGDSENHRIIAVQFVDYRIGKLANNEAPSLLVKLRPAQRVLGN